MRRVATATQEEHQHTTHKTFERKKTTHLKKKRKKSLNSFYNCSPNPNSK
jgi:hypothetical protein